MVLRDGEKVEIVCDLCRKGIPPHKEIMNAGGLIRLGWHCSGGVHICPDHDHPAVVR